VDLFLHLVGKGDNAPSAPAKPAPASPKTNGNIARDPNAISRYQILYWKDIPSEVKAWDDHDEVRVALAPRFAERIDALAQKLGCIQADAYMAELRWSDEAERRGAPDEVAEAVRQELESAALDGSRS
jgi:hypothetical protein